MDKISDTDRVLELLKRGPVLSCELRKGGISGNPSERIRELEKRGVEVDKELTKDPVSGRRCSRYTLVESGQMSLV
jgi:hypothetical protein